MLQTARSGVREIVEGGMVGRDIADNREVESLVAGRFEDRKIRVVGKLLVGGVENRTRGGMRRVFRVELHHRTICAPRLEHETRSRSAAVVDIHGGANFLGPRMLVDENPRATPTALSA